MLWTLFCKYLFIHLHLLHVLLQNRVFFILCCFIYSHYKSPFARSLVLLYVFLSHLSLYLSPWSILNCVDGHTYLSLYLSPFSIFSIFISLSFSLSLSIYSIYIPIYLYTYLSIYLYTYLSIYLSICGRWTIWFINWFHGHQSECKPIHAHQI